MKTKKSRYDEYYLQWINDLLYVGEHPVMMYGFQKLLENYYSKSEDKDIHCLKSQIMPAYVKIYDRIKIVIFHLEEISEEKIQNIKDIRQINPKLSILLVIKPNCQSIQLLQDLGIQGIVFDDIDQDSFRNILNKLYQGDIIVDEQIRELLIKGVICRSESHFWNIAKDSIKKELTQREEEILSLIIEGMSSPEISIKLNISKDTVNFHRKNILSKFHVYGVKNTASLVKFVSKHSII